MKYDGMKNVLVTFSDRKIPNDNYTFSDIGSGTSDWNQVSDGSTNFYYAGTSQGNYYRTSGADGYVDSYTADVLSANDYFAFGAPMPGRNFNTTSYRMGFNGKENDNETYGVTGTEQDYGMRIYNNRLGRFLSVDPLQKKYPWNSTYAFAENDVIRAIDLDGLEKYIYNYQATTNNDGKVELTPANGYSLGEEMAKILVRANSLPSDGTFGYVFDKEGNLMFAGYYYSINGKSNYIRFDKRNIDAAKEAAIEQKKATRAAAQEYVKNFETVMYSFLIAFEGIRATEDIAATSRSATETEGIAATQATSLLKIETQAIGISGQKFSQSTLSNLLKISGDDVITLYRGITGSESGKGAFFLTDDVTYAASYSKNIKQFQVSNSGLKYLQNQGLIETMTGVNGANGVKGKEYIIRDQTVKKALLNE